MKISFIGVGIMGKPMVRNLMKAGFDLNIYARHPEKVTDVVEEGARLHDSIASCVENSDVVITIVGFPKDVEDVYFSPDGILAHVKPGMHIIDMTTTSPTLAEKIYKEAKAKGVYALDAPVTGGETGAIAGTLSILVGGDKEAFDAMADVFAAMGANINYLGAAGKGQHGKMANQIMIAGSLAGICEAFYYAEQEGLDLNTLLKAVATGAAGSKQLDFCGQKIIDENYAPSFFMKHFIKDMKIAQDEARMKDLNLDVLETILSHYQELEAQGDGDLGTQALIKYYKNED
jgi:3-hydroxyisobutyrate dehydrogenase